MIFAGSKVSMDGVQANEAKLAAVVDWRQPPDLLNLSSFLGLTGFFRDLVKGYARLAQPLSDLLRAAAIPKNTGKAAYRAALRNVKLADRWLATHEKAFLGLKQALTTHPVLKAPRFDGTPFIVTSDGCKDGFGAVLAQKSIETLPNGKVASKLHPIAFASKRTSPAEEKYKPFMLEFAALKFAMDKFNDIIWGFPVEIKTDCQAL
jgi:RNase H-like domain found in reverse transcriptase